MQIKSIQFDKNTISFEPTIYVESKRDGEKFATSLTHFADKMLNDWSQPVVNYDFVPFWFEGNAWFKMVNNSKDLRELLHVYAKEGYSEEDVLGSLECVRADENSPKKYGFASECNGEKTLKQHLEQQ